MGEEKFIPVYLFLGFLEGGKTKFIQQTLGDQRFNNGDKTLVLVCEEGIEEYDEELLAKYNAEAKILDDKSELNPQNLQKLYDETGADRVMIEYNGMWTMMELFDALPDDWGIYQVMTFVDAGSFLNYNNNMRSLVVDKLNNTELVVFNRFDKASMDKMEFHKIVRGVSRRTEIAYEYTDGTAEYDDIEDPLPFDVEADHIVVEDRDFALWYRDINEEPEKYDGKKLTIKAMAAGNPKFPKNTIGIGRQIMTCCVEDITFCWLAATWEKPLDLSSPKWVNITAEIEFKRHKLYKSKGPVLNILELEETQPLERPVATFY